MEDIEELKRQAREYYKKLKVIDTEKTKKEEHEQIENRKKYLREYYKERRKNDPIFKLNINLSSAISQSLKGEKKGQHWEGLVGYTLIDLKKHLEAQFKDGMTWGNYGKNGWHIDHRIPISLFNITSAKSKGFMTCWALGNLQPMWANENISKSNKILY